VRPPAAGWPEAASSASFNLADLAGARNAGRYSPASAPPLIFGVIERLFPALRQPIVRPGWWTDLAYWIFTPVVTQAVSRAAVIVVVVPIVL
jgi:hypothetical protein